MSELEIRRAEQALRALADAYGRPSQVTTQFQRDGFHPELWEQLERIDRAKQKLARSARELAYRGANQRDVVAILDAAKRCEGEETKLFVRAFWEDVGGGA